MERKNKDLIYASIIWFVLTFVGEMLLPSWRFIASPPYSIEGELIDEAFNLLLVLGFPVFTFVLVALFYSIFRYRVKEDDLSEDGPALHGSTSVWLTWLIVTGLLAVIVLIHPGFTGVSELRSNPTADMVVQIEGQQWNWTFTYPEYDITIDKADTLVLPVDTRIRFEVSSVDVIHSFWVPAFRMKIDAVPGLTTTMYLTVTETGTFEENPNLRVQCAELCGTGHARMRASVEVVTAEEFAAWVEAMQANAP